MFRLLLTLCFATIIQIVLCAPAENNVQFGKYVESVTGKPTVNKVKDYINNVIESMKKQGNATIESLNAIKDQLLKIGENVTNVAAAKVNNLYGDILEKSAVYFEIADSEIRSFFSSITPNVKNINNSVQDAINSISDNAGGILDNLMKGVGNVVNGQKNEKLS